MKKTVYEILKSNLGKLVIIAFESGFERPWIGVVRLKSFNEYYVDGSRSGECVISISSFSSKSIIPLNTPKDEWAHIISTTSHPDVVADFLLNAENYQKNFRPYYKSIF